MTVLSKSFVHVLSMSCPAVRKTHKCEKNSGHTPHSSVLSFPPKQRMLPFLLSWVLSFQQPQNCLKIIYVAPCPEEEVELKRSFDLLITGKWLFSHNRLAFKCVENYFGVTLHLRAIDWLTSLGTALWLEKDYSCLQIVSRNDAFHATEDQIPSWGTHMFALTFSPGSESAAEAPVGIDTSQGGSHPAVVGLLDVGGLMC